MSISGLLSIIVVFIILIIPGWALLSIAGYWHQWKGLQRWIVAVGLGIAFYPALFYLMRLVLPFIKFGPFSMGALLIVMALFAVWRMRKSWQVQLSFDRFEWIAIAIFGMTLFTRIWIVRNQPFPAWSDSLHHAILTQMTADLGQLPYSMQPYFPIPLEQYHLGLYAITATVSWLAHVPAHTALLWTAQVLNALCGLGVYLALDRKVGRLGAIVGAVVVGLLSHQPAFYVNWGRFTQLASQTVMLIAWVVTWDCSTRWRKGDTIKSSGIWYSLVLAALLNSAVFLLHFRVAAFYLPLLFISLVWEFWQALRDKKVLRFALGVCIVGVISLFIVFPALLGAMSVYIDRNVEQGANTSVEEVEIIEETISLYYEFPLSSVTELAVRSWLLALTGLAALWGLARRNKLVVTSLVWVLVLILIGGAYRLGIPLLNITNMGAVLIMLYLPIGLILGAAAEEGIEFIDRYGWKEKAVKIVIPAIFIAGYIFSHIRASDIEPFRYFVTPEDVAAMEWIKENTPPDALFAVNTFFWLPQAPHGTDAGYWIPYFTGRETTAGVMIISLAEPMYQPEIVKESASVEKLENTISVVDELDNMGVDYIFIGRQGDFSGPGLNPDLLSKSPDLDPVYRENGVVIFKIEAQ